MKKKILVTGDSFMAKAVVEATKEDYDVSWINKDTERNANNFNLPMEGVDTVIHMSESRYDNDVLKLQWNLLTTASMLSWAIENKVKNFIYVSSSEIYGNKAAFPSHESFKPDHINMFGASKYCGEVLCQLWQKQHDLNVLILRPFEVYGFDEDQSVVGQFFKAKEMDLKTIFAHGSEATRDFVHIDDFVAVVKHYLRSNYDFLEVNVGTGKELAVSDIAEAVGIDVEYKKTKDARVRECAGIQELTAAGIKPTRDVFEFIKFKLNHPMGVDEANRGGEQENVQ